MKRSLLALTVFAASLNAGSAQKPTPAKVKTTPITSMLAQRAQILNLPAINLAPQPEQPVSMKVLTTQVTTVNQEINALQTALRTLK